MELSEAEKHSRGLFTNCAYRQETYSIDIATSLPDAHTNKTGETTHVGWEVASETC